MRPRSSSVHCLHRSQHRSSKVCALLFLDSSSSSSRLQLQPRPRKTQSCLVNHHSLKTTKRSLHLFLRSLSPLLVYSSITGLRRSLAAIFRTPSPAGFVAHIYIPFIGTSLQSVLCPRVPIPCQSPRLDRRQEMLSMPVPTRL